MNRIKHLILKPAVFMLKKYLDTIDPKLTRAFLSWAIRHPRYLRTFARHYRSYQLSNQIRETARANGLMIPPFLIISITSHCNLHCNGCYAHSSGYIPMGKVNSQSNSHLSWEKWHEIITEASNLGIFGFVIAGGEPFMFPRLLELCEEFNDRFFMIFTNGTILTQTNYERLKRASNVSVIISLEGNQEMTDFRRGNGVYKKALTTIKRLGKIGILTGISVTITRMNYNYWLNEAVIDHYIDHGVRFLAFLEYIPTGSNPITGLQTDHDLMLTKAERATFEFKILYYRRTKPIYLAITPYDEKRHGGCFSAGRGFVHITPTGDLTPCPVSNIATHNLQNTSLYESIDSPLFREIRANLHRLEINGMPCALFSHPEELDAIAKKTGAYRTNIFKLH